MTMRIRSKIWLEVGGKGGGASRLTEEILELMSGFQRLREQVNADADRRFASGFPMDPVQ